MVLHKAITILLLVAAIHGGAARAASPARPLLLAHYLPWFEAPPVSARWGWHWTMGRLDPDTVVAGRRAVAARYYPVIGPYDSGDPAVVEYHLLLMKAAGIDGIVVDWYGLDDYRDYAANHRRAELAIRTAARLGLTFAVCYEDRTLREMAEAGRVADRTKAARRTLGWLAAHWFRLPGYLRVGGEPVLLSFGNDGLTDDEWSATLGALGPVVYLSEHRRRRCAAGAFDWPVPRDGTARQARFTAEAAGWPVVFNVAFPRFEDFYAQAGVHASWGRIHDREGRTLSETLDAALRAPAAAVQLATWNDWGEGTQIEPSVELGLRDLEIVQRARRQRDPTFPYDREDLAIPALLYRLPRGAERDRLSASFAAGNTDAARRALAARK